ncbi:MAG: Phosphoribosylamine--glycine ligase [Frankiales bacterium]|nr:Phosphoribosylamine--glycine ligase [Frankiales bacterium]
MRVCVVGSGGREHALAAACAREGATVVVTPGNAGIPGSHPGPPESIDADLFVIGAERPLVDGLADRLRAQGKLVFGPGADGARLEGSKAWMKEVVKLAGVETAGYATFTDPAAAKKALDRMGEPFVIKTDGLADGKGVLVTDDRAEAEDAIDRYLDGSAFGDAGRRIVIEEGLTGPELSVLAICDGTRAIALPAVRDYKRLGEADAGPNTGGMGTYSPVPDAPQGIEDYVIATMVEPTLAVLRGRGIDYRGVLYAGLMLTPDGPKLLEYNVRFGDPEAQAVLPRVSSGLVATLASAAAGDLAAEPVMSGDAVVCVVIAAPGYPALPRFGDVIAGMDAASAEPGSLVFSAGVGADDHGALVTAGGRVLNVCGTGSTLALAREAAYRGARHIAWPGLVYRDDIARGALETGR